MKRFGGATLKLIGEIKISYRACPGWLIFGVVCLSQFHRGMSALWMGSRALGVLLYFRDEDTRYLHCHLDCENDLFHDASVMDAHSLS